MFCPKCGGDIENYSKIEGGWCPKCEEWFPNDILEEAILDEYGYDGL